MDNNDENLSHEYNYLDFPKRKKSYQIGEHFYIGISKKLDRNFQLNHNLSADCVTYEKVLKNNRVYSSKGNNKRTNNTFVLLESGNYLQIKHIIIDKSNNNEFIAGHVLRTQNTFNSLYPNLKTVTSISDNIIIVPTENITLPCIFIEEISDTSYIIAMTAAIYY